ncbi:MAG: tRNA (guanosine(37)-N1)-methyltransferase TrmD [Deltaproteobacteria bacterium]|nr:tRNA (guanosine(37)-N1)-methyltransferase TrmD [Deltaproteobacteria bacterium]
MVRFDILTLHPDLVRPLVTGSILGRAVEAGVLEIGVHDIRDHAEGRHRTVDDAPYGGGAGMVMKVDVVARALEAVRTADSWVVLTTPSGRVFDFSMARRLASRSHVVLLCGHYEGIDARIETLVDEEISLGDFVLTGGEIAAAAIVDATARLVPGVLGNEASAGEESFVEGLLEYPQYTRPAAWNGLEVPEVLLSGHHLRITEWRRIKAEARTEKRRPDLWVRYQARLEGDETAEGGYLDIDETGSDE